MIDQAVLRTLAYFDVFNYPLTIDELHRFIGIKTDLLAIQRTIDSLISNKLVSKSDNYYALSNNEMVFQDRNVDNQAAQESMPLALRQARHVKKFPFVRDVMISGSLSKGVMKDDSDFDYFIVTAAKRIWLCKFFLKLYKFFYLKNKRDQFCMNYFISEDDLLISEQNIFTAIELITLMPVDGINYKNKLLLQNSWVAEILPQAYHVEEEITPNPGKNSLTRTERLLNGKLGDILNKGIQSMNKIRNNVKYKDLRASKDYELMTRSTDSQIKVHNSNHQRVILDKYKARLQKFNLEGKFVSIHA